MLNITYVAYYDKKIVGFYTLSADAISAKNLGVNYKEKFADKNLGYKIYPALKLGRLEVHKDYEKKGVGTFLLKKVFKHGIILSKSIGLRFITIDVYMPSYEFYEKNHCKHTLKKRES
jgi:GNAT superfamily N-acetyltransferase